MAVELPHSSRVSSKCSPSASTVEEQQQKQQKEGDEDDEDDEDDGEETSKSEVEEMQAGKETEAKGGPYVCIENEAWITPNTLTLASATHVTKEPLGRSVAVGEKCCCCCCLTLKSISTSSNSSCSCCCC